MIERAAKASLYAQIAAELRARIKSGALKVGDQIPSETDLQERYGVSRMTARLAVQELRTEGLVVTGQGKGTFVADRKVTPMPYRAVRAHARSQREAYPGLNTFQRELADMGREGSEEVTVKRHAVAPGEIAGRLGNGSSGPVVERRRIQFVEGKPWSLNRSWFLASDVNGSELTEPVVIERGANQVLTELGLETVARTDELTARRATPEEAEALRIPVGDPVLCIVTTEFLGDGRPVEVRIRILLDAVIYDVEKD